MGSRLRGNDTVVAGRPCQRKQSVYQNLHTPPPIQHPPLALGGPALALGRRFERQFAHERLLDAPLRERIVQAIRKALTPRHVPNEILQVAAVPRTLTGKKLEVPIKRLLLGEAPARTRVHRPGRRAERR